MAGTALDQSLLRSVQDDVRIALAEDIGSGDLTAALVPPDQKVIAHIIARETAVICGQPWFNEVFTQLDPDIDVTWQIGEGETAAPEQLLCKVSGQARPVLTGERSALNFLQLLSATATAAQTYVNAVAGTGVIILDTRKTLPGLRLAQKYAVRCGGAQNHRIGLFDAILLKENHIIAAGGIGAAVALARAGKNDVLIEVEAENLQQLKEGFAAGADRLLLDNFSAADLRQARILRDQLAPGIALEASGGITLANIHAVAASGIDFISVGAITKDVAATDLSMRFAFAA
jgi:nicotinate-nucleotide pyrophosphorylase (carboxylating)